MLSSIKYIRSAVGLAILIILQSTASFGASDLYMRDTASDGGVEPYPGPGPIYLSPDIWVRHEPDAGFEPYPFSTSAPPWTPLPHQNPEYRSSRTGRPNYVYVRIQNRGDQPSAGTERLRLYQAKASTGLAWPASWVDNEGPICGLDQLQGIEITKPRRNAKLVSAAERAAYRDALLAIQSDAQFRFSDGTQYWRKQNEIHAGAGNPQHGNPAFLAWHREMMNRYEERLREANPLTTLLYWDWTEDPRNGTNLFTNGFMGASSGTVSTPLVGLEPPVLTRNVGQVHASCPARSPDSVLAAIGNFPGLATSVEQAPNHDCAHGYIGGYFGSTGQISSLSTASQDPFFFLLHANVDRMWANWQRRNAAPARLDPVATYGGNASDTNINDTMSPWDGATGMAPWTGSAAYGKTSKHQSVVFPPIYDTAPLNIPVLQPGQSVVIEIPWYPPNVNSYNCAGQAGHFCLLARIETQTAAPFGMTFSEGSSVATNTRNNNNVVWKNLTIVDTVADPDTLRSVSGTMIRNISRRRAVIDVALWDRTEKRPFVLAKLARVTLSMPDEILERVRARDTHLRDLRWVKDKVNGRPVLQVVGKNPRFSVPLDRNESFTVEFIVDLPDAKIPPELLVERFHFDIEQSRKRAKLFFWRRKMVVDGGVRFTLDFAQAAKDQKVEAGRMLPLDMQLTLSPQTDRLLSLKAAKHDSATAMQHLSTGEPVNIDVVTSDDAPAMAALTLEVDGKQVASINRSKRLSERVQFDEPGVHVITTRGTDQSGNVTVRRVRVLVSKTIPPNAIITSPAPGAQVRVGEDVEILVQTSAAFEREVAQVSLYVKEGDTIFTGLNLVLSENYAPVDVGQGPGPHRFSFRPERPGVYMVQIGAVDNAGVTGVSGHTMVRVTE